MFDMLMIAALQLAHGPATADLSQPPQLRNPQAVIGYQDYPTEALRRNEYGVVSLLLRVSTEGRVASCDVTETSGSTTLDMTTCALLRKRAQFEPAKDAAGAPIEGEYRLASSWGVEQHQPTTRIDVPLQVSSVPQGYRSPVKARVLFDAMGHVTACDIYSSSGSDPADRAACSHIKEQLVISAPKSASGAIAPIAVRYLTATLSTQAAEPPSKR